MTAHTSMRGGVNNYLILQYAKLIFWFMPARRFPPPWTVEDIGAPFVVIDIIYFRFLVALTRHKFVFTD